MAIETEILTEEERSAIEKFLNTTDFVFTNSNKKNYGKCSSKLGVISDENSIFPSQEETLTRA